MSDQEPLPSMDFFLASSVHDMKNSVSILISGLEKALSQLDSAAFDDHADLAHMVYEAKRINSNLVQLLTLYKTDNELYPFDPQNQAVSDFLHLIREQNVPVISSQGITIDLHVDDDLYWDFDEDMVSGVIGNALNNAIRYTQDRISLMAEEKNGLLELRIEDNGKGYPQKILDAGADAMRGVDFMTGSTGLGLYFSAVAAKMHRNHGLVGEVVLENGGSLGGGCFVLRLP